MITIFNRRELVVTYDSARQAALRHALAAAGIDYRIRVIDRGTAMSRARTLSPGQSSAGQRQYILYVRRVDWAQAQAAIRNTSRR